MTDDALARLIEAVEAGEWPGDFLAADSGCDLCKVTTASLYAAFSGSLDAAKALHEALLPGMFVDLKGPSSNGEWNAMVDFRWTAYADNPARAWLLAILRALRAEATQEG